MLQNNNVILSDSLRAIANTIENIRHTIKQSENKIGKLDTGFEELEAELKRQLAVQERTNREIQKIKNELEAIKATLHTNELPHAATEKLNSLPYSANHEAKNLKPLVYTVSLSEAAGDTEGRSSTESKSKAGNKHEAEDGSTPCNGIDTGKGNPRNETPVMQGSGFSHITFDYLKKLGNN